MKRGSEEEIEASRAWNYKDVVVKCISKFLSLRDKSMLSQTCRKLYVMFVKHDKSIRLMCGLRRIEGINWYSERICIATSGNLECIRFLFENDFSLNPDIFLKIICKYGKFEYENVLSYLTHLMSLKKFKMFNKLIKCLIENDYITFACSLFTNENSKWVEKDRFEKFQLKFSLEFEELKEEIWFQSVSSDDLETIKKLENTFKCEDSIISSVTNKHSNVFDYFWNQLSLDDRKGDKILHILFRYMEDITKHQILNICTSVFKDNPKGVRILLSRVEMKVYN